MHVKPENAVITHTHTRTHTHTQYHYYTLPPTLHDKGKGLKM